MEKTELPNMIRSAKMMSHALEDIEKGIPMLELCRKRNYRYTRLNNAVRYKISAKDMDTYSRVLMEVYHGKSQAEACREFDVKYSRFNRFVNNGTFRELDDTDRDLFYQGVVDYFYKKEKIVITERLRKVIDDFCKKDLSNSECQVYQLRLIDHLSLVEIEEVMMAMETPCSRMRARVLEDKLLRKSKHAELKRLIDDYLMNYIPDAKCVVEE